ncbi:OmpA family protein [Zavarzinia sp. CC-PAN008]|uniref:OmpA family protein n=1 Tax=Zavarzinia sp. CC-PAN008 TaxID=3243332 RepID=UPI003F743A93
MAHMAAVPVLALGLLAAACAAPRDTVVLVPSADGHVGAVSVRDRDGAETLLDQSYASAEKGERNPFGPSTRSRQEIDALFGPARAAQPDMPAHFRLYFKMDSADLTPESEADYARIFPEIRRRASWDIEVIGHTDSTGDAAYNRELSVERARAMAERLVRDGIPADRIEIAGRGEADLLVATPDETSEPRNRRVAITVR